MRIINKIALIILSIAFVACNGGGEDGSDSANINGDMAATAIETALVLNIKTEVFAGQSYVAKSDDALVTVEHNDAANNKYITLTQGQGVIISQ